MSRFKLVSYTALPTVRATAKASHGKQDACRMSVGCQHGIWAEVFTLSTNQNIRVQIHSPPMDSRIKACVTTRAWRVRWSVAASVGRGTIKGSFLENGRWRPHAWLFCSTRSVQHHIIYWWWWYFGCKPTWTAPQLWWGEGRAERESSGRPRLNFPQSRRLCLETAAPRWARPRHDTGQTRSLPTEMYRTSTAHQASEEVWCFSSCILDWHSCQALKCDYLPYYLSCPVLSRPSIQPLCPCPFTSTSNIY